MKRMKKTKISKYCLLFRLLLNIVKYEAEGCYVGMAYMQYAAAYASLYA